MRRGVWSETLAYDDVRAPRTLALLESYALEVVLAVRPADLGALEETVRAVAGAGVGVHLWPMLDDADGRWASARNLASYAAFVHRVMDRISAAAVRGVAVDLEPPIEDVRGLLAGVSGLRAVVEKGRLAGREYDSARAGLAALVGDARARALEVFCAALPAVLWDTPAHPRFQRLLGTPIDGAGFDRVSVMLYTSLVEGWSRGVLKRDDARAVLAAGARATVARFGAKASVSLGTVGTGAFGDEPVYKGPVELADDVALARAAGAEDLVLFDLGGVLRRPPPEPWLEAFVATPPAKGDLPRTRRVRAASSIGWALRRLPAVGLAVALALGASPARAVDPFEIQVYDGTANPQGAFGLELHSNYVVTNGRDPTAPELPANHQLHETLEPSFGLFPWWELGGYFQTSLRPDGHFDYAGVKLRSKFVLPESDEHPHLRLGVNFELSILPDTYDANRWGSEVRPIVGWYEGGWLLLANPIFGVPLADPGLHDGPTFEPAVKVTRDLFDTVAVGLEYYGDIGPVASPAKLREEEHYLYEVMDLLSVPGFELNAGVGEGLTPQSNGFVVKLILGYTFGEAPATKDPWPKSASATRLPISSSLRPPGRP